MSSTDRYSRQVRFRPLGEEGQARLLQSRVLLVGLGALGSSIAEALVRAGVGSIVLVDRDVVETSNLQRQTLYDEADAKAGVPKAIAAAARLARINSDVELTPVTADFTPSVYADLQRPDLILDGTDNFPTRYLINDLALRDGIPWIYGGSVGASGTAMVIRPGETPCLRCILPAAPATGETATCETDGVVLPAVQMVTAFQSIEAIKLLAGAVDAVTRGIVMIDAWHHRHDLRMQEAKPSPHCPACSGQSYPALEQDWQQSVSLCGRDAVQVQPRGTSGTDLDALAANLNGTATELQHAAGWLRFSVEGHRFSVFPDGRTLVFGTSDPDRARILYDRYVGA